MNNARCPVNIIGEANVVRPFEICNCQPIPFKRTDVVKLLSGGPDMTILMIDTKTHPPNEDFKNERNVQVMYFNKNGEKRIEWFAADVLKLSKEGGSNEAPKTQVA
jgi:uncharacterized protein YodC (DUF2158 family)